MSKIVDVLYLDKKNENGNEMREVDEYNGDIGECKDEKMFIKEKMDRLYGVLPNDPMVLAANKKIFVQQQMG